MFFIFEFLYLSYLVLSYLFFDIFVIFYLYNFLTTGKFSVVVVSSEVIALQADRPA